MIVLNNRLSTTMLLLTIPCVLNIWLNQWILTEVEWLMVKVEWLMVKRVGLQREKNLKWGECNTLYNMLCTALLLLALAFWVNPLTQLVELWFLT